MSIPGIDSQNWQGLIAEFKNTSDRTNAILGSTYLQNHLGNLIGCFFVDHSDSTSYLLDSDKCLGGFGTRINVAYALGLISPNEYHDLMLIFQIRDIFLNELHRTQFSNNEIRKKCFQLKIPREIIRPEEAPTPRRLFVFAVTILVRQLTMRAQQAEDERRIPPDNFMLIDLE
jgi:DNA-binding MltR family transcriptional regulator